MATFQEVQAVYDQSYAALTAIVDGNSPPAVRAEARAARLKLQADFLHKIEKQIGSADDAYRDIARQMQGVINRMGGGGLVAALNTLTGVVQNATAALGPLGP